LHHNDKFSKPSTDNILADVTEMYYLEGQTQAEISKKIGMPRSIISRILTEARQKGIVEIRIHKPLRYHSDLEIQLKKKFNLGSAREISWQNNQRYQEIKNRLGKAASLVLNELLQPKQIIGIAWGTTVQATREAISLGQKCDVALLGLDQQNLNIAAF
jgi:deoxyribonucleoside regulator